MDDFTLQDLQLDNPFWAFSQRAWQDKALRDTLLNAQNDGFAVNLLLFAAWCTQHGLRVENWLREHWVQWQAWQHWHVQHSCALRRQRQSLSKIPPGDVLYKKVLAAELEAERIEQALLYRGASHYGRTASSSVRLLEDNLVTLLEQAGQNTATLKREVKNLLWSVLLATEH